MLPEYDRFGELFLPDAVSGQMRPDVGIVLAVGPDVSLAPGQTVVVRGYDGQWIQDFDAGVYKTQNQVRIYGKTAMLMGQVEPVSWWESIPLILVSEGEDLNLIATGHNLVIQRDPLVTRNGLFEFPDRFQHRTGLATILSIGPEAVLDIDADLPVHVGDRISYDEMGELDFDFGDPDMAVIVDTAVNMVIRERECA